MHKKEVLFIEYNPKDQTYAGYTSNYHVIFDGLKIEDIQKYKQFYNFRRKGKYYAENELL